MACNTFICAIIFGLFKSPKISLFKVLLEKIIEAKVAGNGFLGSFPSF